MATTSTATQDCMRMTRQRLKQQQQQQKSINGPVNCVPPSAAQPHNDMDDNQPTELVNVVAAGLATSSTADLQSTSASMEKRVASEIAAHQPLLSNVETVLHNGESKVALSMDDFQILMKAAGVGHLAPKRLRLERYLVDAKTRENSLGQIRSTLQDYDYTDLTARMPATQALLDESLPPAILKQVKHFESTIFDALVAKDDDDNQTEESDVGSYSCGVSESYRMNKAECRALDIISEAFSGMDDHAETEKVHAFLREDAHDSADIWKILDISIYRLVNMAKKLPTFNDLSNKGKLVLLHAGMIKMLTLHGVSRFDEQVQAWTTPVGSGADARLSIDTIKTLSNDVKTHRNRGFMELYQTILPEIRSDRLAIRLLMVLALFSPNLTVVGDPADKKTVIKHYGEYTILLYRYLRSRHGPRATELGEKALKSLQLLNYHSAVTADLFKNCPIDMEKLPSEFFKFNVAD